MQNYLENWSPKDTDGISTCFPNWRKYRTLKTDKKSFLAKKQNEWQCRGSGMFIPDPGSKFFHPCPRYKVKKIPDPDSHQSIFKPNNCFSAFGKMIWDVHPGFGIFPYPGSRGQKSAGFRIRKAEAMITLTWLWLSSLGSSSPSTSTSTLTLSR